MGVFSPECSLPALVRAGAGGLFCACLLFGCGSGPDPAEDLELLDLPTDVEPHVAAMGVNPLWRGLAAAVDDGDDDLALVLIERIRPWIETEEDERRLEAFERVLQGRRYVRTMSLSLVAEPGRKRGTYALLLLASHTHDEDLVLRLPPSSLTLLRVAVDPAGGQARSTKTEQVGVLSSLEIPAGKTVRVPIAKAEVEMGGALAVRERWSLQALSGRIEVGEKTFPATRVEVGSCQRVRLADPLPLAPVEVDELVRYAGQAEIFTAPLLERAVRIPSSRRGEALAALAPLIQRWSSSDPERVESLAPALRWLTESSQSGLQPKEWAALLQRVGDRPERQRLEFEPEPRGGLELGSR